MDLKDKIKTTMADFCKETCPACVNVRKKQEGLLYQFVVKVDEKCPACKAYYDVYGKRAHEPVEEG